MKRSYRNILIAITIYLSFISIKNCNYSNIRFIKSDNEKVGFTGKIENDLKQGKWEDYFKNGKLAEIKYYKNDSLNGRRIVYTIDGDTILVENYKMGVKIGLHKFYSGGKLNLIEFRDSLGLRQGEFKIFNNGTLVQKGNYHNNEFHGDFVKYDRKTGQITEKYKYFNGVKSGETTYFDINGDTLK